MKYMRLDIATESNYNKHTTSDNDDNKTQNLRDVAFDTLFFKRLYKLLKIIKGYYALILTLLSILDAYIISESGKITGQFYGVIIEKDKDKFNSLIWKSVGIFISTAIIYALTRWLTLLFAYIWRQKLTHYLKDLYLNNNIYYWISDVDNPDQRIGQDLSLFCDTLAQIAAYVAATPFNLIYYIYLTYSVLNSYLVIIFAFISFIVGIFILKLFVSPIGKAVFRQEQKEGYFRAALIRIRQNKSEIALYGSDEVESENLNDKFSKVLKFQLKVVHWNFLLYLTTRSLDYWGTIFTYLSIGIVVFSGASEWDSMESGELAEKISNAAFYLLMLVYTFSTLQDSADLFAKLGGLTPRMSQILEKMELLNKNLNGDNIKDNKSYQIINKTEEESNDNDIVLNLKNVSCWTLSNKLIVENLTLILNKGESLLITGRSGIGKSTFIKCLLNLHEYNGSIDIISKKEILVIPQKSLIAPGNKISEQLIYPLNQVISREEILNLLNLSELIDASKLWLNDDLNQEKEWDAIFSPGEIQRISFARLFYKKPKLIILDEITSSISSEIELKLYKKLKSIECAIISIGHRNSLRNMHDYILDIDDVIEGKWHLFKT